MKRDLGSIGRKTKGRTFRSRFSSAEDGSIAPVAALSLIALVGGLALSAEAGVRHSLHQDVATAQFRIEHVMATSCIVALGENRTGLALTGSAELNLTGCSLISNASKVGVRDREANGAPVINADCIYVVDGAEIAAQSRIGCDDARKFKSLSAPAADPYGGIDFDPMAYCNGRSEPTPMLALGVIYYEPGCYRSGLALNSASELAPGLYVLFDDLAVGGDGAVIGKDVTFVMAGSSAFTISDAADVTLSATTRSLTAGDPELEQFVGILIFGDNREGKGASHNRFVAHSGTSLDGALYVANGAIDFQGGPNARFDCLQLVADAITISGTATMRAGCEGKDFTLPRTAVDSVMALVD